MTQALLRGAGADDAPVADIAEIKSLTEGVLKTAPKRQSRGEAMKRLAVVVFALGLSCGDNSEPPKDAGVTAFPPPLPDLVIAPAVVAADSH
jgi:hypothetical protein